jgi:hypothetical protein
MHLRSKALHTNIGEKGIENCAKNTKAMGSWKLNIRLAQKAYWLPIKKLCNPTQRLSMCRDAMNK